MSKICPSCMTENTDDAAFCHNCGSRLSNPAQEKADSNAVPKKAGKAHKASKIGKVLIIIATVVIIVAVAVVLGLPKLATSSKELADKYCYGEGVEQNYVKAMDWYKRAAGMGNAEAMYSVGYMYENGDDVEQDYAKAMEYYQKAAEKGNAEAMNNIAILYDWGLGVEQDYAMAAKYRQMARDNGYTG